MKRLRINELSLEDKIFYYSSVWRLSRVLRQEGNSTKYELIPVNGNPDTMWVEGNIEVDVQGEPL